MTTLLVGRAADFQAAWFFGLLLLVIMLLILVAAAYVLLAVRRLWRAGQHGVAAILGGATVLTVLGFAGMYASALGGLIATGGTGS